MAVVLGVGSVMVYSAVFVRSAPKVFISRLATFYCPESDQMIYKSERKSYKVNHVKRICAATNGKRTREDVG